MSEASRAGVAEAGFDLHRALHGDPHPGNVLVDTATGQIIFLDLGMMGTLNSDKRLALADLIWSLAERDGRECARVILRLTVSSRKVEEEKFLQDVERLRRIQQMTTEYGLNLAGVERVLELERKLARAQAKVEALERRSEELREEIRALEERRNEVRADLVRYEHSRELACAKDLAPIKLQVERPGRAPKGAAEGDAA